MQGQQPIGLGRYPMVKTLPARGSGVRALLRALVIAMGCALFGVSCQGVKTFTDSDRVASFKNVDARAVGSDSMRDHVLKRTAFVIAVEKPPGVKQPEAARAIPGARARTKVGFGSAAAVDRRGYFVTAAHCLDGNELNVAFMSKTGLEMRKARVVFKGDATSSIADFAILHVPARLDYVFEWGTTTADGDAVISAGTIRKKALDKMAKSPKNKNNIAFSVEPVGGHIGKVLQGLAHGVRYHVVLHDSPLTQGNSGGPLVDKQGRLLAVNITGAAAHPSLYDARFRYANAVRPDLDWVMGVIERDAGRGR